MTLHEADQAPARRRRIRDLDHKSTRWIVSVVASLTEGNTWKGRLVYFDDQTEQTRQVDDDLAIEALDFENILSQAASLSVEEIRARLVRQLERGQL